MRIHPLAALLLAVLPSGAPAQTVTHADSGRFVIFDRSVPVAREFHVYQFMGDSLVISATTERQFQDENGQRHDFTKSMLLVVNSQDLGLMRYLSNQDFNDHKGVRGILPGDTVMTYYDEYDGVGNAVRLVQPPGRLFVLDPQLFTLFDVLCRSVAGKQFETRGVQLVALAPDSVTMPRAKLIMGRPDTLDAGGRRVPTRRYTLEDNDVSFELWADARGRMMRLENELTGLSVERVPEPQPAVTPRKRAPAKR